MLQTQPQTREFRTVHFFGGIGGCTLGMMQHWMKNCYTSPYTGERFGWGHVLDYIGVPWEDDWRLGNNIEGQLGLFEEMETT